LEDSSASEDEAEEEDFTWLEAALEDAVVLVEEAAAEDATEVTEDVPDVAADDVTAEDVL
jgi:hypothetical protein